MQLLFIWVILTGVCLFISPIILPFGVIIPAARSSFPHSGAIAPPAIANISGTYAPPNEGFEITLPKGWRGIDLDGLVMASPRGINPTTGGLSPTRESNNVLLVLGLMNASDFLVDKKVKSSTYQEFVKKTAKIFGCSVLSDSFVKINGANSEKIAERCGLHGQEKSIIYIFSSGKKVIFIGLKGIDSAFNHNLQKFEKSLQTIKIDAPTDIENVISGLYVSSP
jgi:hypothetical protein